MTTATMSMENHLASKAFADELWISFVSLLRSYLAMRSIAQPGAPLRVLSSTKSELVVLGPWGKLHIVGPDNAGNCATELRPETAESGDEYETFHFTEDGLLRFQNSDGPLEMEAGVEHLLRKVQA
ncbi:MAG: hypothetical protein ACYDC6_08420 [Acidobacteriaceae bacterium]